MSANLTPDPYPLDDNGYTADLDMSPHVQASVEKALDNRSVPNLMRTIITELEEANTNLTTLLNKIDVTNTSLSSLLDKTDTVNSSLATNNTLLQDIKDNTTPSA